MSTTSGQIMVPVENQMTDEEFEAHFLEIIHPLHDTVLDNGAAIYLKPNDDKECARGIKDCVLATRFSFHALRV